jgi:hypothetical protein
MIENMYVESDSESERSNNSFVSRCKRKFRSYEDLKIKSSGGMLDLFDNMIKEIYRITDDEYDYLADNLNENEYSYFILDSDSNSDSDSDSYSKKFSFADKKECLRIIEKHLFKYYNIK